MTAQMFIASEDEIRAVVSMAEAVEAVEDAHLRLHRGEAQLPPVLHFDFVEANGEVHCKGASIAGSSVYVIKVASGFYGNPARGLPVGQGLVLVFDAVTGQPVALLLDNGFLTDLRTGAAGAVAARHLAREDARTVGIIGAGLEAGFQLHALAATRPLDSVRVWSRDSERREAFARRLTQELGVPVTAVASAREAVADADIIVTATPARTPVLERAWVAPGAHVSAVGSDVPDKQELPVDLLAAADVVVADRLEQCLRQGELHHAVEADAIAADAAVELGAVIAGDANGRTSAEQITIADLTGVGVQDAAVAALAYERLLARTPRAATAWTAE